MESSAGVPAPSLRRETRVFLENSPSSSTVQIRLPTNHIYGRSSNAKRSVSSKGPGCRSEAEFKKRHIANRSSIFFRSENRYPRSFLWRCVEDNTTLEVRSVDLTRSCQSDKEANLVIQIGFPHAIKHECIAFADPTDSEALNIFVVTKNHDLYTFTLRPDFFCRPTASEDNWEQWCKISRPSNFSISTPHRLVAPSALELIAGLSDGKIVRLIRKPGEYGSKWAETSYNEGPWLGALRSLIPFQGTNVTRYDGAMLEANAALSFAESPDHEHLFAVCRNHTLKSWNLNKGGSPSTDQDLLGVDREVADIPKLMLDPGLSKLLHVFECSSPSTGDKYNIVTFSPHDSGVFKFWGVRDGDFADGGVRDLFPDSTLKLPDPADGALWTMADFKIKSSADESEIEMWILMRLNRRYKLFSAKFDSLRDAEGNWQNAWSSTVVRAGHLDRDLLSAIDSESNSLEDISTRWLNHLFKPNHVPTTILETAIHIFAQSRGLKISNKSTSSLRGTLLSHINEASQQKMTLASSKSANYHDLLHAEYSSLWIIIAELIQTCAEPISLAYDTAASMSWIVLANGCAAVRDDSELEVLSSQQKPKALLGIQNALPFPSVEGSSSKVYRPYDLAVFFNAVAAFRASFTDSLNAASDQVLDSELWQEPSQSIPLRLIAFYDQCKFASEIHDNDFSEFESALQSLGGWTFLSNDLFMTILDMLPDRTPGSVMEASGLKSTSFGLQLVIGGAQEMISTHLRMLTNLLYLVVVVDAETDHNETPMEDFDAAQIYDELLKQIKCYKMMDWLANNVMSVQAESKNHTAKASSTVLENVAQPQQHNILEQLFAHDIAPIPYTSPGDGSSLTKNICKLLRWATGGDYEDLEIDNILVHIQCSLIKNNNLAVATTFLKYQPSTAWSTYIRGRLSLLLHDYEEAAIHFRKAAFRLSRSVPSSNFYADASHKLLDPITSTFLASGLPNYYTHITNLFDAGSSTEDTNLNPRPHLQVMEFASLALQFFPSLSSPSEQYSDLLARLFNASVSLQDYSQAYSALMRYSDTALQHSALAILSTHMIDHGYVQELLDYPFIGLKNEVDDILAAKVKRELILNTTSRLPAFKVLYAWRVKQGDFRGAASVMIDRLVTSKAKRPVGLGRGKDIQLEDYLLGINALAVTGSEEEEGWVFVGGEGNTKRSIVRLQDVRRDYQHEMDRRGALEMGRFGIVGGDEDEEDVEMGL